MDMISSEVVELLAFLKLNGFDKDDLENKVNSLVTKDRVTLGLLRDMVMRMHFLVRND